MYTNTLEFWEIQFNNMILIIDTVVFYCDELQVLLRGGGLFLLSHQFCYHISLPWKMNDATVSLNNNQHPV